VFLATRVRKDSMLTLLEKKGTRHSVSIDGESF